MDLPLIPISGAEHNSLYCFCRSHANCNFCQFSTFRRFPKAACKISNTIRQFRRGENKIPVNEAGVLLDFCNSQETCDFCPFTIKDENGADAGCSIKVLRKAYKGVSKHDNSDN
jgi:hypothetical protein